MDRINRNQIGQLMFFEKSAEENLIDNMIGIITEQFQDEIPRLKMMNQQGLGNDMSAVAHKLKSSAGQLGLNWLEKLCLELETEGRRKGNFNFLEAIDKMDIEFKVSIQELKHLLSSLNHHANDLHPGKVA